MCSKANCKPFPTAKVLINSPNAKILLLKNLDQKSVSQCVSKNWGPMFFLSFGSYSTSSKHQNQHSPLNLILKGKWDHLPTTMFRRLSMINLLPPDVCVSPKWWCPKTTKLGSQDIATITSVSSGGLPSRPCIGEDFRNVVGEIRTPSGSLLHLRNREYTLTNLSWGWCPPSRMPVITKNMFCFEFLLCWLHPGCGIRKYTSPSEISSATSFTPSM